MKKQSSALNMFGDCQKAQVSGELWQESGADRRGGLEKSPGYKEYERVKKQNTRKWTRK